MTDNKSLVESLDKHLSNVSEAYDDNLEGFKKWLNQVGSRFGSKTFLKLVLAVIEPSLTHKYPGFTNPRFNDLKPLLIADIKDTVATMVKGGMSKEEAIASLLDPNAYDEEVGNYADTTFTEPVFDMVDRIPDGLIFKKFAFNSEDMRDYLDYEIKRNYKSLIQAVK